MAIGTGLLLSLVLPPFTEEYGGGDPSNFINNAVRFDEEHDSSFEFYPPAWRGEDPPEEEALDAAFLRDGRGNNRIMSPYVTVRADGDIHIPHGHLYSHALSLARQVEDRWVPYLLNYAFLGLAALLGYLVLVHLTASRTAAAVGGVLVLILPSHLDATRITRTETLVTLLFMLFTWLTVRERGATAWPGMVLLAMVLAREEWFVPLYVYLGWAALRRKPGAWTVALTTVVAGYLIDAGSGTGLLFPTGRKIFSFLPDLPLWTLLVGVAGLYFVGLREQRRLDGLGDQLRWLGSHPWFHRAVWLGLVGITVVAELLRQRLDPREAGFFILKGQVFSTSGMLIDTLGWPLLLGAVVGLVWQGHRLAGRAPFILAVAVAPHAFVLLRIGVSPPDLLTWTRRFHGALYPVLILGVALLLAHLVERVRASDRDWADSRKLAERAVVAVAVLVIAIGLIGPWGRLDNRVRATRGQLDAFHDAAGQFDEGAVLLLDDSLAGLKAQTPLRTFHGTWSFLDYGTPALTTVLDDIVAKTDGPVYMDAGLRDRLSECGVTTAGDVAVVPVAFAQFEDQLELAPITVSDPVALATCDPPPAR